MTVSPEREALVIAAKYPEAGTVKTRLAAAIGDLEHLPRLSGSGDDDLRYTRDLMRQFFL